MTELFSLFFCIFKFFKTKYQNTPNEYVCRHVYTYIFPQPLDLLSQIESKNYIAMEQHDNLPLGMCFGKLLLSKVEKKDDRSSWCGGVGGRSLSNQILGYFQLDG